MTVFTLGFTQKSAKDFFTLIKENNISVLVDIRLNNISQLAGFTKGRDLEFFLEELCECKYEHEKLAAPTKDILDGYKKGNLSWEQYELEYEELIKSRETIKDFLLKHKSDERICLLCSEPTPEHCHRRLFARLMKEMDSDVSVRHL